MMILIEKDPLNRVAKDVTSDQRTAIMAKSRIWDLNADGTISAGPFGPTAPSPAPVPAAGVTNDGAAASVPSGGWPKTTFDAAVQASLTRADAVAAELVAPAPTGGDDTAAIQAAIDAASAAGSGLATGRYVRLRFGGRQTYSTLGLELKSNVWLDFGQCEFVRNASGGSVVANSMLRTIDELQGGSTYYGKYKNIKLSGGVFNTNGNQCSAHIIRFENVEDGVIDGVTVQHTTGCTAWAFQVGGRRIRVINPTVLGGSEVFQDGVHITHGRDISVVGGYVASGDDALAFGIDASGTNTWDDEPLSQVTVDGTVINSAKGSVKVYYGLGTFTGTYRGKVDGLTIHGVTGYAGKLRNGPIAVLDTSAAPSPANIKNVQITGFDLKCGDATHDGSNPYGAWVNYGTDVDIRGTLHITDSTGGATRFRVGQIDNSVRCNMSIRCDAVPELGGIRVQNSSATQYAMDNSVTDCALVWAAGAAANSHATQLASSGAGIGALRTRIDRNKFINLPATSYGCYAASGNHTLHYTRNWHSEAASGNGRMVVPVSSTTISYLEMKDNDASGLATPMSGAANTSFAVWDISGNKGFATHKGGVTTLTSGNTSVTVNVWQVAGAQMRFHDATTASLPLISVTPIGTLGAATKWWIGASTDQAFTINVDANPGQNVSFAWFADTSKKPI